MNEIEQIKRDCRHKILSLYKKANAGHIASSLSCLDLLIYEFGIKTREASRCQGLKIRKIVTTIPIDSKS